MSRPRRILRFLLKAAATLMFVLGLTLLVAWPFTYAWGAYLRVTHMTTKPRYWKETQQSHVTNAHYRTTVIVRSGVVSIHQMIDVDRTHEHVEYTEERLAKGFSSSELGYELEPVPPPLYPAWRLDREYMMDLGVPISMKTTFYRLTVPVPALGVALISPALLWLALAWRRRRRTQYRLASGLCLHCGYSLQDLRGARGATGDACPECGAARPASA